MVVSLFDTNNRKTGLRVEGHSDVSEYLISSEPGTIPNITLHLHATPRWANLTGFSMYNSSGTLDWRFQHK